MNLWLRIPKTIENTCFSVVAPNRLRTDLLEPCLLWLSSRVTPVEARASLSITGVQDQRSRASLRTFLLAVASHSSKSGRNDGICFFPTMVTSRGRLREFEASLIPQAQFIGERTLAPGLLHSTSSCAHFLWPWENALVSTCLTLPSSPLAFAFPSLTWESPLSWNAQAWVRVGLIFKRQTPGSGRITEPWRVPLPSSSGDRTAHCQWQKQLMWAEWCPCLPSQDVKWTSLCLLFWQADLDRPHQGLPRILLPSE